MIERLLPDNFGTGRQEVAFSAVNPRGEVPVLAWYARLRRRPAVAETFAEFD